MSTPKASIALVIETLYAVAADPDRWEQVIEALDAPPVVADDQTAAEGARLVRAAAARDAGQSRVGVILVGAGGGAVAANSAGEAVFSRRLGVVEARGLKFLNPVNHEALVQARRRLRETATRQVIVKFQLADDEGPAFAYVTPAGALPPDLASGLAALAPGADLAAEGATAMVFPAAEATDRLWVSVRESFGLTPAETRLAARLKDGLTLREAADELSVSVNTVRNQLRAIFDKMGLNRQSELVRALTQLSTLAGAFDVAEPARPWSPAVFATEKAAADRAPPVQIFRLSDGRAFAWRDYGDPQGKPVLGVMQDIGSSLLTRGTDALARDLGLRLVVPERAGAGRSDPHPRFSFAAAAADYVELCRALGLDGLQVVSVVDGAPYGIETARQLGDSVSRILMVSGRVPGPQVEREADSKHLMTLFWRRISRNPWLSDMMFEMLRLTLNRAQFDRFSKAAGSAPADAAYLRTHPEIVDFMYEYTSESLAVTARGASDAIRCAARSTPPPTDGMAAPITLWHGAQDSMNTVEEMRAWLGEALTQVRVVPDIGRFLAYSHWAEVMAWLADG